MLHAIIDYKYKKVLLCADSNEKINFNIAYKVEKYCMSYYFTLGFNNYNYIFRVYEILKVRILMCQNIFLYKFYCF